LGRAIERIPVTLNYLSRHGRALPGHPRLVCRVAAWMPATSAGMTKTRACFDPDRNML
jgi:hypothetical protein